MVGVRGADMGRSGPPPERDDAAELRLLSVSVQVRGSRRGGRPGGCGAARCGAARLCRGSFSQRSSARRAAPLSFPDLSPSGAPFPSRDAAMELHGYQLEAVAPALRGRNSIVWLPTGAGKTRAAVHVCRRHLEGRRGGRVAVLVNKVPGDPPPPGTAGPRPGLMSLWAPIRCTWCSSTWRRSSTSCAMPSK